MLKQVPVLGFIKKSTETMRKDKVRMLSCKKEWSLGGMLL